MPSPSDSPLRLQRLAASDLDAADTLVRYRAQFHLPYNTVYLNGNSLGPISVGAKAAVLRVLSEWREHAGGSWLGGTHPWFGLTRQVAEVTAPLLGAEAHEVAICNSTTVNLHQLLATFFKPAAARSRILVDPFAFPSDRYAVVSHLALRGLDPAANMVTISPRGDLVDEDDLIDAMKPDVAVAVLPAVIYTTGQLLNVELLAREAARRGILLVLDCSHSVGAVPHLLHDWGVDFAFWCGYKYLNGGPGAAAGMFVHSKHLPVTPGLAGWFSSDPLRQFEMSATLYPSSTAAALQIGTPNILSVAPLLESVKLVVDAGIGALRERSLRQTALIMECARVLSAEHGIAIATPVDDARRGGHVALRHPNAAALCTALECAGVVPDFRPPDIIRLAPAPLFTTYYECVLAMVTLADVLAEGKYA